MYELVRRGGPRLAVASLALFGRQQVGRSVPVRQLVLRTALTALLSVAPLGEQTYSAGRSLRLLKANIHMIDD